MDAVARLALTDPRHTPVTNPNVFQRAGLALINDERDLPFLGLALRFIGVIFPLAAVLYWRFNWWLAIAYTTILFAFFFGPCILMLHNTSHRVFFKPQHRWMNHIIPWVLCPFFGQPPEGYFSHHMGMHHPENNLEDDLSTTMPYDRDKFLHFLKYWSLFMATTIFILPKYLSKHGRKKLAVNAVVGEAFYYLICAIGVHFNPLATLAVFVIPYVMARFLMMWGNWGQHAFIDAAQPGNALLNSITCINVRYNRTCFNDGYHIGHHVKANRHWTDMPADLENNAAKYAAEGAVVFQGIDFFQVSLFLFLKRYDWLAERFVELREQPRSRDEIIAFLKTRTRPIVRERQGSGLAAQAA